MAVITNRAVYAARNYISNKYATKNVAKNTSAYASQAARNAAAHAASVAKQAAQYRKNAKAAPSYTKQPATPVAVKTATVAVKSAQNPNYYTKVTTSPYVAANASRASAAVKTVQPAVQAQAKSVQPTVQAHVATVSATKSTPKTSAQNTVKAAVKSAAATVKTKATTTKPVASKPTTSGTTSKPAAVGTMISAIEGLSTKETNTTKSPTSATSSVLASKSASDKIKVGAGILVSTAARVKKEKMPASGGSVLPLDNKVLECQRKSSLNNVAHRNGIMFPKLTLNQHKAKDSFIAGAVKQGLLNGIRIANTRKETLIKNVIESSVDTVLKNIDVARNKVESTKNEQQCYAIPKTDEYRLEQEKQIQNAEYIYDYLKAEGWTTEAICGLLGNIQQESQMNPGAWQLQDNVGRAYGLVQWDSASEKFLWWLEEHTEYGMEYKKRNEKIGAKEINDLAINNPKLLMDLQLEYLVWSCQPSTISDHREWFSKYADSLSYKMTYEEYISSHNNVRELTLVFEASYERSEDGQDRLEQRQEYAEQWYEYFIEKEKGEKDEEN